MASFEAAGLVLATAPIVIDALRAYNESIRSRFLYQNKSALIVGLIDHLSYFHFCIRDHIEKVFDGAGLEYTDADFCCDQTFSVSKERWSNQVISQHLGIQDYTSSVQQITICQGVFASLVSRFEGLIPASALPLQLMSELRIDAEILQRLRLASQRATTPGRPWEDSRRKLKFSYKTAEIHAKLRTLRTAVDELKILDRRNSGGFVCADAPSSEITSRALTALLRSFEKVQQQAARLYIAIAATLPQSCHRQHSIRLFLDERAGPLKGQQRRPQQAKAQQVFHVELLGYASCGSIDTWHRCEIPADDLDDDAYEFGHSRSGHDHGVGANNQPVVSITTTTLQKQDQKVNWETLIGSGTAEAQLKKINCFCTSIRMAADRQMALELRLARHGALCYKEWSYYSPPESAHEANPGSSSSMPLPVQTNHNTIAFGPRRGKNTAAEPSRQCTTLQEVIERAANPRSAERSWTLEQRMVLALRLGCSVLQLSRTYWLSSSLASTSIYFHCNGAPREADQEGMETYVPRNPRHPRAPTTEEEDNRDSPSTSRQNGSNGTPTNGKRQQQRPGSSHQQRRHQIRAAIGPQAPFDADNPFITRSDPPGFFSTEPQIKAHPLVLDLGIVLMELWSLETFSQYCSRQQQVGDQHDEDDLYTDPCDDRNDERRHTSYLKRRRYADEWLAELDAGMPLNYRRAVRRAMEFASRDSYHFEDDAFRADFCDGIVKPLWENCQHLLAWI